ncbi:hypothetical protein [Mycolicibacterium komossense]|uniref:HNH endonuclease n=1 Tax=Mycolicibacterium komossense TaxID=1779 RepID=A0ABT3CMK5_9MYCO|nr:hypothetical protein [Mycolicibacterium komossense]MCV7230687.1 hypothetical protein [Mycolicibacterium komossense]
MAATRKRPSPAERGYDDSHRTRVERLKAAHVDGTPCWWCGLPMFLDRTKNPDYDPSATRRDGKPDLTSGVLHGEHSAGKENGAMADKLLHGLCNKQRGDGSRDHERPALRIIRTSNLGDLVMGWPTA